MLATLGDGDAHLVQIAADPQPCPNLEHLLSDPTCEKLFHFGRFDIAMLKKHVGPFSGSVFCTKIASKLCRTYTDRHGLADYVVKFGAGDIKTTAVL